MDRDKKVAPHFRTRSRTRRRQDSPLSISMWGRIPLWVYIVTISVSVLGLGIGLQAYLSERRDQPIAASSFSLPANRPVPPNAASVGEPANGFSLKDAYEQTYTLNPGDGQNHLLVFYMGIF